MSLELEDFESGSTGEEGDMPWEKMRMQVHGTSLPGDRGRYLLWVEPPLVEGEGRYVHFSWAGESYCVRDYIKQQQTRALGDMSAADVWSAAEDRKPCTGELYKPVEDYEFWVKKLTELTERHNEAPPSSGWSPLSTNVAVSVDQPRPPANFGLQGEPVRNGDDPYRKFIALWAQGRGFEVIERTVGCSARYRGEPLLWVYPRYFQVAPGGKGNGHEEQVRDLMRHHFPEVYKGKIPFRSEYFTWDRFQRLIADVKQMIQP